LIVIQSINLILEKSSTLNSSDIFPLLEPIINLGPRTKSSGLKREILKFLRIIFSNSDYSKCFNDNIDCRILLQFNLDEMIHDTRSNEISEQAKELKKQNEHLFEKLKIHDEQIPIKNIETNDLF
jgi:ubiquitin C-terminal hydrolase